MTLTTWCNFVRIQCVCDAQLYLERAALPRAIITTTVEMIVPTDVCTNLLCQKKKTKGENSLGP